MAIDEVPEQEVLPLDPENSGHTGKFFLIFLVLAALAVAEIYTLSQLSKISSLRDSLEAQQAQARKQLSAELQEQLSGRLAAVERSNAQRLNALKDELDAAAKRMGKTGGELRRARAMVAQLQKEQERRTDLLKQEIAQKADQQQLGALTQDVVSQRSDLETTKKAVGVLTSDLGMARSEMGTLIARNHQDIEYLRKLGDRDYYEFTLERNHPQRVAGIGLELKKTNVKHHRFNVNLVADDMQIEKNNRTINEPIFFYVQGSKRAYELVVNSVQSNQVKGYVSTPKGATEVAVRSEGTR